MALEEKRCRECGKPILVVPYFPHSEEHLATGMPAHRWNRDREQDRFVGWICNECAFERTGEGKPGMISGPELMFHY